MTGEILIGDVREQLRSRPEKSVHCVVTSPPYWALRDYGVAGQLGLEASPEEYVAAMVEVFAEVWRVLRDDGTCWVNLGDSYASDGRTEYQVDPKCPARGGKHRARSATSHRLKPKDLVGIPWRVAFALQAAGWYLRSDIIWSKPSPMPESVRDRPTKSHEYLFLLTKNERYFYDAVAVQEKASSRTNDRGRGLNPKASARGRVEGGEIQASRSRQNESFSSAVTGRVETRNLRTVWRISSQGFKGAHFATFPPKLVEPCIKAGTSERGCCPTCGAPWKRNVEKQRVATRPGADTKTKIPHGWAVGPGGHNVVEHQAEEGQMRRAEEIGNRDPLRHVTRTVTTGWQQACKCPEHEPIPCTVLDPFLGSGTTALMAEHLGRNWLGCELNPDYAEIAKARIGGGYKPPKTKGTRRRSRRDLQKRLFATTE